jgi:hypothetical protein
MGGDGDAGRLRAGAAPERSLGPPRRAGATGAGAGLALTLRGAFGRDLDPVALGGAPTLILRFDWGGGGGERWIQRRLSFRK